MFRAASKRVRPMSMPRASRISASCVDLGWVVSGCGEVQEVEDGCSLLRVWRRMVRV